MEQTGYLAPPALQALVFRTEKMQAAIGDQGKKLADILGELEALKSTVDDLAMLLLEGKQPSGGKKAPDMQARREA